MNLTPQKVETSFSLEGPDFQLLLCSPCHKEKTHARLRKGMISLFLLTERVLTPISPSAKKKYHLEKYMYEAQRCLCNNSMTQVTTARYGLCCGFLRLLSALSPPRL